ncbi:MAG: choice-of-anchor E domain-containing protein [Gammaproteobacteria bacterium]|nr:choice-of-anchor E domain-containing protein [Gammaproteobacteria bacterium]
MTTEARRTVLLPLAASIAIALMSQAATAATISTSAVVPVTAGSGSFTLIPASGLAQFDPANGTLTGILLSLDVSNYELTLSLGSWEDPGTGAQFESADLSAQLSISAALPAGGGLIFASTAFAGSIYDEFETVDVSGSSGGPVFEDATARLISNNLFADFIGTGDVSILELGVFTFGHPQVVMLDDGSFAEGSPGIDVFNVGPSTLRIDYTYTPTVVPAPAAVWLLGSGLLGLAGIKRARKA